MLEEDVGSWHFYRTPTSQGATARLPVLNQVAAMDSLTSRLSQVAQEVKPDILHAHSPVLNAIPALRVGRRLGIPVVYEVRAFWEDAAVDHGTSREWGIRYRLTRGLESYALKRVNAITTICEGLRGDILGRGIPPEKVTVIPNAVNIENFRMGQDSGPATRPKPRPCREDPARLHRLFLRLRRPGCADPGAAQNGRRQS